MHAQYHLGMSYFRLDDCPRCRGYLAPIYTELSNDGRTNAYLGLCYASQEPKALELASQYLKKAEALGYDVPEDWLKLLETPAASEAPVVPIVGDNVPAAQIPARWAGAGM